MADRSRSRTSTSLSVYVYGGLHKLLTLPATFVASKTNSVMFLQFLAEVAASNSLLVNIVLLYILVMLQCIFVVWFDCCRIVVETETHYIP